MEKSESYTVLAFSLIIIATVFLFVFKGIVFTILSISLYCSAICFFVFSNIKDNRKSKNRPLNKGNDNNSLGQ